MTMVEALEGRRLFALVIAGTPGDDTIHVINVSGPNTHVVNNGVLSVHPDASFTYMLIDTFGGNDTVNILFNVPQSCTVHGGPGNDLLRGGKGFNDLWGDQGNDRLIGGPGVDHLWGGIGDDYLSAGAGKDQLWGGPGYDQLIGGLGSDLFLHNRDRAIDHIWRNPATDTIYGAVDALDQIYNSA